MNGDFTRYAFSFWNLPENPIELKPNRLPTRWGEIRGDFLLEGSRTSDPAGGGRRHYRRHHRGHHWNKQPTGVYKGERFGKEEARRMGGDWERKMKEKWRFSDKNGNLRTVFRAEYTFNDPLLMKNSKTPKNPIKIRSKNKLKVTFTIYVVIFWTINISGWKFQKFRHTY